MSSTRDSSLTGSGDVRLKAVRGLPLLMGLLFRGQIDGPMKSCGRCGQPLHAQASSCPVCGTAVPPTPPPARGATGEQVGGILWLVLVVVGVGIGVPGLLMRCGPGLPPCYETQSLGGLGLLLVVAGLLLAYLGERRTPPPPANSDVEPPSDPQL